MERAQPGVAPAISLAGRRARAGPQPLSPHLQSEGDPTLLAGGCEEDAE